jgi:bifunctional non-homologous end joining protein LigD
LKCSTRSDSRAASRCVRDGYRVQVHINSGRKKVYARNGLDWTKRFTTIAGVLDIPGEAIIDGEVAHEGRTNFSELQAELAAGRQDRLVYYAFDLLWRDGDLRELPGENDIELPVLFSEHLVGDGQKMFEHAAKLKWEDIISKRADAPYRSDRNEAWLKIKAVQKGKFPVVGFVKDSSGIAALYLDKQEGKELVYMSKVGTGWSRTISSQIGKQLDTVVSPKSKLTKPIRKPKATWVEPKYFADVNSEISRRTDCCGRVRSSGSPRERSGLEIVAIPAESSVEIRCAPPRRKSSSRISLLALRSQPDLG